MFNKIVTTAMVLTLSTLAPAMADPVHMDVSVGSVQERVLVNNVQNVSSVSVQLSRQMNHKVMVYGDATESLVNRQSNTNVASTEYSALTGDLGMTYTMSHSTTATVQAGTRVNDQQLIPGASTNIPYVGVMLKTRVF